jgi:hypothetical protein
VRNTHKSLESPLHRKGARRVRAGGHWKRPHSGNLASGLPVLKASGITDPDPKAWQIKAEHVIGVQLQVVHGRLFVEVWDRTPETPVRQHPDFNATSGRGLLLVESLAEDWGIYRPHVGGKVVWAELPVELPADSPPFDLPHRPLLLPADVRAPWGSVEFQARQALLDRLTVTTLNQRR